jgi:predicted lipid-binding transport protein (Tim44 family)
MRLRNPLIRLFILFAIVLLIGAFSLDAEAKRMGGGQSIGRQSGQVTQRYGTPPKAPSQSTANQPGNAAGAAGAAARKPWAGLLGGLAAGLGLAWLAHALGLGPQFANLLLIALLVMVALAAMRWLRRPRAGTQGMAYQGVGASPPRAVDLSGSTTQRTQSPWLETSTANYAGQALSGSGAALAGSQSWGVPAGFDVDGFMAAARRNFTTLQRAWDERDLSALGAMMTDEMYDEMRRELAERPQGVPNRTEVLELHANLLGVEELEADDLYMASVEFSGTLREERNAPPAPFREVWNLVKPRIGPGNWRVAGLQQVA